jgi:hypothetical protein
LRIAARAQPATVSTEAAREIAIEAYLYFYPLVLMDITHRQMTNVATGVKPGFGPMDTFAHVREFPPAEFRAVVRPNFDTLYSVAWLDLTAEPRILTVPDTDGRYYLLPVLDMWTDVFAVPGKRTSGTGVGSYALVGPHWQGTLPDDVEEIRAPTPYVWIIGRTQTNGPRDYDAVNAIQDGYTITRLSGSDNGAGTDQPEVDPTVDTETAPLEQVNAMGAADFFATAARLTRLHPPHSTDWSILARMRRIGIRPGEDFTLTALDEGLQKALGGAPAAALQLMREALPRITRVVNGWALSTDSMGVYGNFYLKRAIVALVGLGANPPEDAFYPLNVSDATGEPLDGGHDYTMHFASEELPPVDAFWSVTMYDGEGFQAANPIDRFAIGDRDDLRFGADGSLDLYLQHENPGPEKEPNWLPAPRGPLGVTMRLYAPKPEALDGRWVPPPIVRTD